MEYKQFRATPYWVSNDGRIISYQPKWGEKGRPIKTPLNDRGYAATCLHGVGAVRVHQLVMEVWGPPKPDTIEEWVVDHIDETPTNNHISNLRWLTKGDNARRGHRKLHKLTATQEADLLRR